MTVIYFVQQTALTRDIPGFATTLPFGVTPEGVIVSDSTGPAIEVSVLFVNDGAHFTTQYGAHFALMLPATAIMHDLTNEIQKEWLKNHDARVVGRLSHSIASPDPAYEQVKAILRADSNEKRQAQCTRVLDAYKCASSLTSLEALAALLALRQTKIDYEKEIEAAYQNLWTYLDYKAKEKFEWAQEEGTPSRGAKASLDITVEECEAAASTMLP